MISRFENQAVTFELKRRWLSYRVLMICVLCEIALLLMEYFLNFTKGIETDYVREIFDLAEDHGLAGWFAVIQTFMVGITLLLIFGVSKHLGHNFFTGFAWLLLAAFFIYMSADDAAMIHESLGSAFGDSQEANPPAPDSFMAKVYDVFPSYNWQFAILPFFVALGIFMVCFLWVQTDIKQKWMMVIAVGSMAFAIALDFVDGMDEDHPYNLMRIAIETWDIDGFTLRHYNEIAWDALEQWSMALEETLEMFSITLFWVTFLSKLEDMVSDLTFRFEIEDSAQK